ncbi:MAG: phosphoribosylformimino-5-aminoimidazole carboxamide ribotide isomerase [Ruminococcus sp.]|nr:phosphoribosylformimino-5-aminoimidazole carboxamide ribotide isomerase [Ruminococcus sp.]
MKFRPCIDIHNGSVKQIVGGSLADKGDYAVDNFVSEYDGAYYGGLYKSKGLSGGHIIILNPSSSEYYDKDVEQAYSALSAFEGGLQIGGGISDENAKAFLDRGASHVIVTSFVFKNGTVNFDNLDRLVKTVGKNRLVLDLSCRKRDGDYYIVTDRWQKFTDIKLDEKSLDMFSSYCDELLIHAVDVEGKARGIEEKLVGLMGNNIGIPATYAGGISSFEDLDKLKILGKSRIDFTIGSALDIFGGNMKFEEVCAYGGNIAYAKITNKS